MLLPQPAGGKLNNSQLGSASGGAATGAVGSETFDDKDNDFEGDDGKIFDIRLLALEQSQQQQKELISVAHELE